MKIYHNPRCGKSRKTLALLEENGQRPEIILYLKKPPSAEELESVLNLLNFEPYDLIRTGESLYKEKFKGQNYAREEWLKIMVENPILIERPIVVHGDKAIIGRPPENVLSLI